MTESIIPLKTQFDLHTRLYANVLEGITNMDADERKHEAINNMKWIAGHLLNTRVASISRMVGGEPFTGYTDQFGRGNGYDPKATYPALDELVSQWKQRSGEISERLGHMSVDALAGAAPFAAPVSDDTLKGTLSFLISHEAYHIGQLSILRKMAGSPAMEYK